MKTKKSSLQFIFNAVIIALVLMAIMHAFAPYMGLTQDKLRHAQHVREQIRLIAPDEVEKRLKSPDGKPTVLVVYASWCKYCRQVMPQIVAVAERERQNVHFLFLSRDREGLAFATYLVRNGFDLHVAPYVVDGPDAQALQDMLESRGVPYQGGIPFIAVFTPDGRFLQAFSSNIRQNSLLAALDEAGKKTH